MRRDREWLEKQAHALRALIAILLAPQETARAIERTGNVFAHSIRAAIGPDELERIAREKYMTGEYSASDLDAELDRIQQETWRPKP